MKLDCSYLLKTIMVLCMIIPATGPLLAQDEEFQLEEVIVTARKREENLQDIPISVLMFGSEQMEQANINNLEDITSRVPGLTLNVGNATDVAIFMRGIGSDIESSAAERAFGIFLDGIYLSRVTGASMDIFDMQRVEVLRGPQSLVFGKNIVGGLTNYVTNKPTPEFASKIEATMGNYSRLDVQGFANGQISENTSGRLSFSTRSRDGFADITGIPGVISTTNADEEDNDSTSLRGQLLFTPSSNLDVLFAADYMKRKGGSGWQDLVYPGTSTALSWLPYAMLGAAPFVTPEMVAGVAATLGLPPDFSLPNRNAPWKNTDPRAGRRNFEGYSDAEIWGLSARVDWAISDTLSLMSLTAYRDADLDTRDDGCGLPYDFPRRESGIPDLRTLVGGTVSDYLNASPDCYFDNGKRDMTTSISQELTLTWDDGGKLIGRGGLYYLNEDISRDENVNHTFSDFQVIPNVAFRTLFGGPSFLLPDDLWNDESFGTSLVNTSTDATNFGVFGEIAYAFNEKWTLNAGMRWSYDKKDFYVSRDGVSFDRPLVPFEGTDSNSWDAFLPEVSLTYSINDQANIYARYAKGYKAGGWNGENAANDIEASVSFDPETAQTIELGAKMSLAQNRVRLNMDVWAANYDDLQTQQFVVFAEGYAPNMIIVNADGTEAHGFEADIMAQVTDKLALWGNYAYTDCEFTESVIVDAAGTDIKGNTCRRTPKHAFSLGGDLNFRFNNGADGWLRADYNWTDEYFFENTNLDITRNDSEYAINASAGYHAPGGNWSASIWVKNLTDELNVVNLFTLFDSLYAKYQPPRTYGVTLRYEF